MSIQYIKGDATQPSGDGQKIIVHICNDVGKWGMGFVLAISERWMQPESTFKDAYKQDPTPQLGDVQFVQVSDEITVANIIGQHGVRSPRNKTAPAPIRYDAVRAGLEKVAARAQVINASVHMPRIGCGLAGGAWKEVEPIVFDTLVDQGVATFVYDF